LWDVVGHEGTVRALARSAAEGRLSHAYLFLGPRGVGKTHLALRLAQSLNCTAERRPCGECRQCTRVLARRHADVQVITLPLDQDGRPRKSIPIESIQDLQRTALLQPYEGACRVFIIDGADLLSAEAANCLLKTLEEPPAAVCLVLLAEDEGAIPDTVLSRCRTFQLRPVPRAKIEVHLQAAYETPKERAALLAALAEGRIGWAIHAAQDDGLLDDRRTEMDQIESLAGLPYHDRLDTARVLAEEFGRRREDGYHWLELTLGYWRDVALIKGAPEAPIVNIDRREALSRAAAALSFGDVAGALRQVARTRELLEKNANARLALDVLMLRLPVVPAPGRAAA
jgi:DNA polymerase-3 subunit delta'